jgi:hypothetical protein
MSSRLNKSGIVIAFIQARTLAVLTLCLCQKYLQIFGTIDDSLNERVMTGVWNNITSEQSDAFGESLVRGVEELRERLAGTACVKVSLI